MWTMNISEFSKFPAGAALLAACCSCGSGSSGAAPFPAGFDALDDAAKVRFVMDNASPDSVARFICRAALGHVPEGRIDTLAVASAYAYENYADTALMLFSREFDSYSASLPLADKMRIYYMAGTCDAQRLGYELGLEYVGHIREAHMGVADIKSEISAFRDACRDDSMTYVRFVKGFRTALRADRNRDLPDEVYREFSDLPE